MLTLTPPAPAAARPALAGRQRDAVVHRTSGAPALLVLGAPGTGKTTTALAIVADRLADDDVDPGRVLLLAPTRRAAARLRDDLSSQVRRTTGQPVVRTPASLAFSVLRSRASLLGEPTPTLISGPEQDLVLADLLAGHAAGEGATVTWPPSFPPAALGLRAFRDELRDLLMRAAERGLRPEDLARLGRRRGRPEWVAAAAVYAEYLDVTRLRSGTPDSGARFDPAVVLDEASEALRAWEAEVPGASRPTWDLVCVDDYQEGTAATARLLAVLAQDGADLVLLADPDTAVQTFRGASPALVGRATLPAGSELGAFGADVVVLDRVWRHGPELRDVVRAVTEEIRGTGRAQRAAEAEIEAGAAAAGPAADPRGSAGRDAPDARDPRPAQVRLLRSPAQEAAYVAAVLRSCHLHDGVPWGRMAVVVRSGAQVTALRRALLAAQVPVAVLGSDVPLRAEPAVRPLLLALGCVLDPGSLTAEIAAELLVSPLGRLDAVGLRRLRRALRAEEVAGGGTRSSDPLLVELLSEPTRGATLPAAQRRAAVRLAELLAAGREALARPGAGVLDVLWALWSGAGLAEPWRRSALAGGPGGARADRDLDAVLALFTAAEQFVDRLPQAPPRAFLEHLQSQDLPADTLAAHGDAAESVAVLTAAGAAGAEWDVVVVAGVQEGVWPDLRLRDSMLGAQQLVEVLAGREPARAGGGTGSPQGRGAERGPGATAVGVAAAEARAAVLDDELRAFAVAVSRARHRLVVTAVRDADLQPSALVDLVQPGPAQDGPDPRLGDVPPALDLRSVVARCRAALEAAVLETAVPDTAVSPGPDHPAAALLALLAAEGVPGADPSGWPGTRDVSDPAPLWGPDEPIAFSPSKLESASTCALRWALEAAGGRPADSGAQSLGTLVHAIAAELPHGSVEELSGRLDERWPELGLDAGWLGSVARRRADAMIRRLAAYLAAHDDVVAVEQDFTARLGRVLLRGSVDRLERVGTDPEGRPLLRVVDLKTGKNAVGQRDAERHAQLGAYQAAVDAGAFDALVPGAASAGARLVYVGTDHVKAPLREQPALSQDREPHWAHELVEQVADAVTRSALGATSNALCRSCPVTRSCPTQSVGRVVGA